MKVQARSLPRATQIRVTAIDGHAIPEGGTLATAHAVSGGPFTRLLTPSRLIEVSDKTQVEYSTDLDGLAGVQHCQQHGVKAQRPGGIWYCRQCYRDQQARYRARLRGDLVPATPEAKVQQQRDAITESVDRVMAGLAHAHLRTRTEMFEAVLAARLAFYGEQDTAAARAAIAEAQRRVDLAQAS